MRAVISLHVTLGTHYVLIVDWQVKELLTYAGVAGTL